MTEIPPEIAVLTWNYMAEMQLKAMIWAFNFVLYSLFLWLHIRGYLEK
jgi:hypothetical protein